MKVAILILFFSGAALAQPFWQPVHGPLVNRLSSVAVGTDGTIFAGTSGMGVQRSTDMGATWQPGPKHSSDFINAVITLGNAAVLAGTGGFGVEKSTDNGVNWTTSGLSGKHVNAFVLKHDGEILCGTDAGIQVSTDSGTTWQARGTTLATYPIGAIVEDPAHTLLAATGTYGMYRSNDNGISWTRLQFGFLNNTHALIALQDGRIFAGGWQGGFYQSTDHGSSWARLTGSDSMTYFYTCAVDSDGNIFLGASPGGIWKSRDAGATWQLVLNDTTGYFTNGIAVTPDGAIIAGTDHSIQISHDHGASWHYVGGMDTDQVGALGVDAEGNIYSGSQFYGMQVSHDHGVSWTRLGLENTEIAGIECTPSGAVCLALPSFQTAAVSHDRGATWNVATLAPVTSIASGIIRADNGDILVSTTAGVHVSHDDGSTYAPLAVPTGGYSIGQDHAGNVYLGCGEVIFRASLADYKWHRADSAMKLGQVKAFALGEAGRLFAGGDHGVQYTTDAGIHWLPIDSSILNFRIVALLAAKHTLFAAGDSGVWRSTTNGDRWERINDSLSAVPWLKSPPMRTLAIDAAGYLYVGGRRGIFRSAALIRDGVRPESDVRPTAMRIASISPDPASSTVSICIEIEQRGSTTLELLNALGERVGAARSIQSEGTHFITWNTTDLPPGVYAARLTGEHSAMTRLVRVVR